MEAENGRSQRLQAVGGDPLLEVRNLKTFYPSRTGILNQRTDWVKAVDNVSLSDPQRRDFRACRRSPGCGKPTLGRSIMRLERPQSGQVMFEGEDILALSGSRLKALRPNMQVIFQDPHGSLDPRMNVRQVIAEGLVIQGTMSRDERDARVERLVDIVGLRKEHLDRYPHEFTGGQRQRIGIARALALRPKFVLADEPVSALDVSVQSQVLNLCRTCSGNLG